LPAEPDTERAIVDVGNPLMGFLLGALLIAGTMGSFFLWDKYQGGGDAKAGIMMSQR
jgi:hypothetical protein